MARIKQRPKEFWPAWRYDPAGRGEIFQSAEDVPIGWTRKPGDVYEARAEPSPTTILDRDVLVAQLMEMEISIKPTWGNAHMQRIINGDASPAW